MSNRKERFFGIHMDFHATPEKCKNIRIGEKLTEELIEKLCDEVQPDFLQIDAKGHPGYTSYPTKAGTAAADFCGDPLRLWRKVTAKKGVALLAHYSGIWDAEYLQEHPEEAASEQDPRFVSLFSDAYLRERMIPQLKELAIDYALDGVWVDGDCWAVTVEKNPRALGAFFEKTGIALKPEDIQPENPYFSQYREFLRDAFRSYVRCYTDEIHKVAPDFLVASNWAFSEQMPEKVSLPVDFLSGDFSPNDSFNGVLCGARILAAQDFTWDLMTWGFRRSDPPGVSAQKTAVQLMQEAACILSLGGGFQIYLKQLCNGNPPERHFHIVAAVSQFCRERKPYCFGKQSVPNAVLFNSTTDHDESLPQDAVFGRYGTERSLCGWSRLLAHTGHSFEVREEHNLFDRIEQYPMVICPAVGTRYTEDAIERLTEYARHGGLLVLSGCKTLQLFQEKLPFAFSDAEIKSNSTMTADHVFYTEVMGERREIVSDGENIAWNADAQSAVHGDLPIASIIPFGSGKIVLIAMDVGTVYQLGANAALRTIADRLLDEYSPVVRIHGTRGICLHVSKDDDRMFVHLVNGQGQHEALRTDSFDEIPPVYHITVEIACDKPPRAVRLQPSDIALDAAWENGVLRVQVERVDIYEIIEILL